MVHASVKARAPTQKQQNDGVFGSVDCLLLTASLGSGVLSNCTYIHRLHVLGGKLPSGFYGSPAYATSVPNFSAAIPYQAQYTFLSQAELQDNTGRH
ncbi:g7076 [Coccomyxa elongata]